MPATILLSFGAERLAMLMAADRDARRVRETERGSRASSGARAVTEGGGVVAASLLISPKR